MSDFPMQKITIYHKNDTAYERYVKDASYRNTSVLNHSRNGSDTTESALIRIFDVDGYNSTWYVAKGDVVVNSEVDDDIDDTPLTTLSKKYGTDNVHKVTSIDKFIFDDDDVDEINHIKIGAI